MPWHTSPPNADRPQPESPNSRPHTSHPPETGAGRWPGSLHRPDQPAASPPRQLVGTVPRSIAATSSRQDHDHRIPEDREEAAEQARHLHRSRQGPDGITDVESTGVAPARPRTSPGRTGATGRRPGARNDRGWIGFRLSHLTDEPRSYDHAANGRGCWATISTR